ncbi:MAG TPA: TIGR03667 family PPOX class F420-dependent oxidoreductase [Thermomicrobiaceae bacterium]|nr:TIGR03667 family PPOX class F420-dependent oxidoreductase [Thermomicrobiaceae bacterium]
MLDVTTEQGRAAERRLRDEEIVWLATVRHDGQPQVVPVWFLWDGSTFLIYSRPRNQKLRNIRANPRVALNLNSDSGGNAIVRVEGTAEIVDGAPLATDVPAMVDKYRDGIRRIGMDPAGFARAYSVAIRVRPDRFHLG